MSQKSFLSNTLMSGHCWRCLQETRERALESIKKWVGDGTDDDELPPNRARRALLVVAEAVSPDSLIKEMRRDTAQGHLLRGLRLAMSPEGEIDGVLYMGRPADRISDLQVRLPDERYTLLGLGLLNEAINEIHDWGHQPDRQIIGLVRPQPTVWEPIQMALRGKVQALRDNSQINLIGYCRMKHANSPGSIRRV